MTVGGYLFVLNFGGFVYFGGVYFDGVFDVGGERSKVIIRQLEFQSYNIIVMLMSEYFNKQLYYVYCIQCLSIVDYLIREFFSVYFVYFLMGIL